MSTILTEPRQSADFKKIVEEKKKGKESSKSKSATHKKEVVSDN